MNTRLNKVMIILVAIGMFAWFNNTFFDNSSADKDHKRVEATTEPSSSPGAADPDEPVALAEKIAPAPSQRGQSTIHDRRRAAAKEEIKRRTISEAQKAAMREKWKRFYSPSPMCKSRNADWDVVVRCANELLRANDEFERLNQEGKL
ncbi:MAG: hypothetical protein ABFS02_06270 [Pseudomonadota bacterium]